MTTFVKYSGQSFVERRIGKDVLEDRFGITVDEDLVWNAENNHQLKADEFSPELLQLLSEQAGMVVVEVGGNNTPANTGDTSADDDSDDESFDGDDDSVSDFVGFGSDIGSTDKSR